MDGLLLVAPSSLLQFDSFNQNDQTDLIVKVADPYWHAALY